MTGQGKRSYFGPFFWLSLAAFAVPVAVAIKAFDTAPPPAYEVRPDASGVDQGLWDQLLKRYTVQGLVDYGGLAADTGFRTYLKQVGSASPEKLATDKERLAFYINAYNALVMNGVIVHRVGESVMKVKGGDTGFFDLAEHIVAGETVSLNHIEHKVVRKRFPEPRIHVALVCAARSCPVIRAEAFTGANLERQLEDQARLFANDPAHVRYDTEKKTLHLSAILKWYGRDFDATGGIFGFLAQRADDKNLKAGLAAAQAGGQVQVVFNTYDWALNTQGETTRRPGGGRGEEFGSGSVPNR